MNFFLVRDKNTLKQKIARALVIETVGKIALDSLTRPSPEGNAM